MDGVERWVGYAGDVYDGSGCQCMACRIDLEARQAEGRRMNVWRECMVYRWYEQEDRRCVDGAKGREAVFG